MVNQQNSFRKFFSVTGPLVVFAASIMQTCLGGIYGWSAYVPALHSSYRLTSVETSAIFGVTTTIFVISMIIAGRLQERFGPQRIATFGALIFCAGYQLASFSQGAFLPILIGIGIFSGAGIGCGYVTSLSTATKWYPKRLGLVTGIVVAGYGGGSIILSKVVHALLSRGWDVLSVFSAVGLTIGAILLLCTAILQVPKSDHAVNKAIDQQQNVDLRLPLLGMFAGTFGGLMVIGSLAPIAIASGLTAASAVLSISFFALGNMSGRVVWGLIYDKIGNKAIPLSLLLLAGSVLPLTVGISSAGFYAVALSIGFNFGACFVLYVAYLGKLYGPQSVGRLYPVVLLSYAIAGSIGPLAGGWCYDLQGSYSLAIISAALMGIIGAGAVSFLLARSALRVKPQTISNN
jgi:OFA family oxalate/formate antiporter-like MFS transporter